MDEILSATVDSRNGIVLDPRTKLFMLITITTLSSVPAMMES